MPARGPHAHHLPDDHAELLGVIALAGRTNRLANALQIPVDPEFDHKDEAS
jgi:alkylhydroperoxidase family enzyme